MNKTTIFTIILIVVLIGGIGVYFYISGGVAPSGGALLSAPVANPDRIGADALALLNQVKALHIDATFFSGDIYKTLVDRTQVIREDPVGHRANPFSPVPGVPSPFAAAGSSGSAR